MFIPDVITPDMHISDPSQLVPGMELWHVGQGGVCHVSEPHFQGTFVAVDKGRNIGNEVIDKEGWILFNWPDGMLSDTSMLDCHILPQSYNNWYMCKSESDARAVFDALKAAWTANPLFEQERQAFDEQSRFWDDMFDDHFDDSYPYDER